MKVVNLKALVKEHELRGYSKLRKAELSTFLQNNLQLCTRPPPSPPPPTWEPIDDRHTPSVRFRPNRPRQPELLRQLDERNSQPVRPTTFKPYQLKPKRGKETFIEPPVKQPPSNQKQIKCMKKKLGELNKKISHSKKKHNNLISKRNSIKKKIKELKRPREPDSGHHTRGTQTTINLIENQTHIRTYWVTGSLNHDISNLILDTIHPVIQM